MRMKPMSSLYRSGLLAPIEAPMFFDLGGSGQSAATRFQGLSAGNTSRAAQIASASGVWNRIGLVIARILTVWMRLSRAGSPLTAPAAGALPKTNGVTARSMFGRLPWRTFNRLALDELSCPPANATPRARHP